MLRKLKGTSVKIADVQILFYAIDPIADLHGPAARWFENAINDREPLGLAWSTLHQFLRLGTHPAFPGCMTDDEAMGWVEEWIDAGVEVVGDADLRWGLFVELALASRRSLRYAIDDAYLAAIVRASRAALRETGNLKIAEAGRAGPGTASGYRSVASWRYSRDVLAAFAMRSRIRSGQSGRGRRARTCRAWLGP